MSLPDSLTAPASSPLGSSSVERGELENDDQKIRRPQGLWDKEVPHSRLCCRQAPRLILSLREPSAETVKLHVGAPRLLLCRPSHQAVEGRHRQQRENTAETAASYGGPLAGQDRVPAEEHDSHHQKVHDFPRMAQEPAG